MKISSIGYVLILILISITIVSSSSNDTEVEDQTEFNYEQGGAKGPENWGILKPEWALCGNGTMQSPIALMEETSFIDQKLGFLRSHYLPSSATLMNRGHDIMLKFEGGNAGFGININGTEYKLQQIHWHSPSEHTINGKRFVLEEHMVHQSKDGRIAVVAFVYKLGRPDLFLLSLETHLWRITNSHESEEYIEMVYPRVFNTGYYFRYHGSLTTPPCSENVIWTISKEIRTVTVDQLALLRVAVHDQSNTNARPLQPRNGRPVTLFKPNDILYGPKFLNQKFKFDLSSF